MNGRVPPHDLDAERTIVSACLLTDTAFPQIQGIVHPEHFYAIAHQHILQAIYDLEEGGRAVDMVSVRGWLKDHDRLDEIGGGKVLLDLQATPAIVNIAQHAETVRDKARIRELIRVCQRTAAEGYAEFGDPQQFIDEAEQRIFDIARVGSTNDVVSIGDATREAIEIVTAAKNAGVNGVTGVATGFTDLDSCTTGLHEGELFVVAGRPGMGKTAYVLNVAANIAQARDGNPSEFGVVFFSLEMPREQLALRLLASEARVDVSRLRSGDVRVSDWSKITDAAVRLQQMPLWIDDTPAITLLDVRSKVRRLQARIERDGRPKKLGLVAIDYLQLMRGRRGAGNREQEISELSRGLKQLAKEMDVPVVALSQLNRSVETRSSKDKRPQLSDLRESGAIEQDADTILFIYRDEYYFKEESADKGIAEIIIAKQRNGPTSTVRTKFTSAYTRFDNLAHDDYPAADDTPLWARPRPGDIDDGFGDFDDGGRNMAAGR
jgi:replicative DNA helicase